VTPQVVQYRHLFEQDSRRSVNGLVPVPIGINRVRSLGRWTLLLQGSNRINADYTQSARRFVIAVMPVEWFMN
jgi:hypothetical protein